MFALNASAPSDHGVAKHRYRGQDPAPGGDIASYRVDGTWPIPISLIQGKLRRRASRLRDLDDPCERWRRLQFGQRRSLEVQLDDQDGQSGPRLAQHVLGSSKI